ncbi:MAG: GNAT family N-acetyltransferase [Bacteroidia bacterium]
MRFLLFRIRRLSDSDSFESVKDAPKIMIETIPLDSIERVVSLSLMLPEFHKPYSALVYKARLAEVPHLILIKRLDDQDVAFKVGYERKKDGSFYSWMGGVLPQARRKGIALDLALEQERWAKAQGYRSIKFKTLNRHKKMLHFALGRGFDIIGVDAFPERGENRIWLEKEL